MIKTAIRAALILTAAPTLSLADPSMECERSSQVEIGACVAKTLERMDISIDIFLGFAMTSAEELDRETGRAEAVLALNASQAAWIAYRDKHCEFAGATMGGGSGAGIRIESCRIELGRDRAEELSRHAR